MSKISRAECAYCIGHRIFCNDVPFVCGEIYFHSAGVLRNPILPIDRKLYAQFTQHFL
jgi:hypothetical protein